jgi:hypothetical protein
MMMYRPQFFGLEELVCKHVYDKFGDIAWMFLDERALVVLDWIRRSLGKPILINNWANDGMYDERGLRCNLCPIVRNKTNNDKVYMSAHVLGRAYDFDVDEWSAGEVRVWIAANKNNIPYNIRLENNVDWVHLDTYDMGKKVYIFNL